MVIYMFKSTGRIIILFAIVFFCTNKIYAEEYDFVRVSGNGLIVGEDNREIFLRGMGFGNFVADHIIDLETLLLHHDQTDFQRLADIGMNVVRFNTHCGTLEDFSEPFSYRDEGWEWLDINIEWARATGMYLNLVLMAVPGSANGSTIDFWDNNENQQRFIALWTEVARRYADEPVISGYDILNEPITSQSPDQWTDLANTLIDSIRFYDQNHMIILEPLYGVRAVWDGRSYNPDDCQFLVDDPNVLHDIHFYTPFAYTNWFRYSDNLPLWPDDREIYLPLDVEWVASTSSNPSPPSGTTNWTLYEGNQYLVDDPSITIGLPSFISGHNPGTVWFDDYTINQYDDQGSFEEIVYAEEISSSEGWFPMYKDWGAEGGFSDTTGHNDNFSSYVRDADSYGGWTKRAARFNTQLGKVYSVDGWMQSQNMPDSGFAQIRLDFMTSSSGLGLQSWNREFLEYNMDNWIQFGVDNGFPMSVGEFGADRDLLDNNGGLQWFRDVIEMMIERNLSFTMHLYDIFHDREDLFDIYAEYLLTTDVENLENRSVKTSYLSIYPSPSNSNSTIRFDLETGSMINIRVYNMLGQLVLDNKSIYHPQGKSSHSLDLNSLASGLYLVKVNSQNGWSETKRIVVTK
jgi:endoglucanase